MKHSIIGFAAVAAICLGGCDHGGDEAAAAATRAATAPEGIAKDDMGNTTAGGKEAVDENSQSTRY